MLSDKIYFISSSYNSTEAFSVWVRALSNEFSTEYTLNNKIILVTLATLISSQQKETLLVLSTNKAVETRKS